MKVMALVMLAMMTEEGKTDKRKVHRDGWAWHGVA